jgi:flagellar basal-body rod protein FlgG
MAATGMLVQRKKMDVITNNITNVDTTGYKKDQLLSRSFKDMLISKIDDPAVVNYSTAIGSQNTGVHIDEVVTDFSSGSLEETGEMTDLAIQGDGFFTVSTKNGERYTRDGSFSVNSEGYLVTADGNYVLGTSGKIRVGTGKFTVSEQGVVSVNGTPAGKLKIVNFADTAGLRKEGSNLYANYSTSIVSSTGETAVKQGCLEGSNVDIASEMVDMLSVSRMYETNQRMVKMLDESLDKAVNEVGRV